MADELKKSSSGNQSLRSAIMTAGMQPQYNDIFNKVFSDKIPEAVIMGEKTEARLRIIKQKFDFNKSKVSE